MLLQLYYDKGEHMISSSFDDGLPLYLDTVPWGSHAWSSQSRGMSQISSTHYQYAETKPE